MKNYYLLCVGLEPINLGKMTRKAALASLRREARNGLTQCRLKRVKGYLHKIADNHYAVTLAPDLRSTLWQNYILLEEP